MSSYESTQQNKRQLNSDQHPQLSVRFNDEAQGQSGLKSYFSSNCFIYVPLISTILYYFVFVGFMSVLLQVSVVRTPLKCQSSRNHVENPDSGCDAEKDLPGDGEGGCL